MVFYSALHSLPDNFYHSIYFLIFANDNLELTFQSIIHSDYQMFFSLDAAEKHKNNIAFIFLLTQHATRAAEKLPKLSLKDVHSAIEHTSYNNAGKE